MSWREDLSFLSACYETWDDLADDLDADVQGEWLRQIHNRRIDKTNGHEYASEPSQDLQHVLKEHRERLRQAHKAAGEMGGRTIQTLNYILEEVDLSDEERRQVLARKDRITEHTDTLLFR